LALFPGVLSRSSELFSGDFLMRLSPDSHPQGRAQTLPLNLPHFPPNVLNLPSHSVMQKFQTLGGKSSSFLKGGESTVVEAG
jgi:hypothetical protein